MAIGLWGVIKGLLVKEETDRTKELSIEVSSSATTGTRTTIEAAQTANRTVSIPDATDTLVGRATTDTLSNKTLDNSNSATLTDNNLTIQDDGDNTKQARFNAGTIGTGQTRTFSLPDADTTVVGTDTTQTLTNKSIDADTNTITNIENADIKTGAAIDAAKIHDGSVSNTEFGYLDGVTSGIQGQLDAKAEIAGATDNRLVRTDGAADIQQSGITIDDTNNVTGVNDLTVDGNLTVNGTTTTVNTSTLDVADSNITVNDGGNDASAEGAGMTVERTGTDGSLVYEDALASKFKAGALGSEVEIANVSSAQTLTNKTIAAGSNTISGLTHGTEVDNPSSGVHGVTGSVVGTTDTQALTNKDIDGGTASNTSRITIPQDTKANLDGLTRKEGTIVYSNDLDKLFVDDGTNLNEIGSGGEAGKNYFSGGDFEINEDLASKYDSGGAYGNGAEAGGGTVIANPAINSTTPLAGSQDLRMQKQTAADAVGEGYTFTSDTIDRVDRGKVLYFSADIDASDASYTSGDLQIKAYDITNSAILAVTPVANLDDNAGILNAQGRVIAKILCEDTTAQVRVSLHMETDSATGSTWDIYVDDAKLSPDTALVGAIVTDWQEYDLVIGGSTSAPTKATTTLADKARWRRVGQNMEITYSYKHSDNTGAAAGSGNYLFPLPAGYTIDNNNIEVTQSGGFTTVGTSASFVTGDSNNFGIVAITNSTNFTIAVGDADSGYVPVGSSYHPITGAIVQYTFTATVPIAEWASSGNVISANEAAHQTIFAEAQRNTNQSIPDAGSSTTLDLNATIEDPFNMFDLTNNYVVFPKDGLIQADAFLQWDTNSAGDRLVALVYNEGAGDVEIVRETQLPSGSNATGIGCSRIYRVKKGATLKTVCLQQGSGGNLNVQGRMSVKYIEDFTTFGTYGEFEVYNAESSNKTLSVALSNDYLQMTGNSIELPPGTWKITGQGMTDNPGSDINRVWWNWKEANGDDTATNPQDIGTNFSYVGQEIVICAELHNNAEPIYRYKAACTEIIIRNTNTASIYLVPRMTINSVSGSPFARAYIQAERLQ